MSNIIKQYVRHTKGKRANVPYAVLVAVEDETGTYVDVGWSMCHGNDHFEKKKGTLIALNRAVSSKDCPVPDTIAVPYDRFVERVEKYFFEKPIIAED